MIKIKIKITIKIIIKIINKQNTLRLGGVALTHGSVALNQIVRKYYGDILEVSPLHIEVSP